MPVIKTTAVVGSAYPAGDKDLIVHLLAREFGRLSVAIRGGQGSKGGRAATLQPLAEVEVTAYLREGRDLATLREDALVNPHTVLRNDLGRLALASFLLDVALESSLPGHETPDVYDLMCFALGALETAPESPPLTAASHWLLRLLTLLGVEPTIDETLLTGGWREGRRKPRRYLLYLAEGMIAAAPGEPGARMPPGREDEQERIVAHESQGPSENLERNLGRDAQATGRGRRGSEYARGEKTGRTRAVEPGHGTLSGPGRGIADEPGRRVTAGPRAYSLAPAAVRAVYENQRADTEQLASLPLMTPRNAVALLRALIALALALYGAVAWVERRALVWQQTSEGRL